MKKKIIIGLILLSLAVLTFLVYQTLTFRFIGTNPGTNKISVISPYIDVEFSKPLNQDSVALSGENAPISKFDIVDKKILRIFLTELKLDTRYRIIIESIAAEDGKQLKNQEISFTTKDIEFDDLPRDQQQAILELQDKPSPIKSDPVLEFLPYGGLNYEINAVTRDSTTILQVRLLLSAADVRINASAAAEQYKQEARDYISSNGINPKEYTFEYEIVQPSIR